MSMTSNAWMRPFIALTFVKAIQQKTKAHNLKISTIRITALRNPKKNLLKLQLNKLQCRKST